MRAAACLALLACLLAACSSAGGDAIAGEWRCRGSLVEQRFALLGEGGSRMSARMTGFRTYRGDGGFTSTLRLELERGGGVRIAGSRPDDPDIRNLPGTTGNGEVELTGSWHLDGRTLRHVIDPPADADAWQAEAHALLRRAPAETIVELRPGRLETRTDTRPRSESDHGDGPGSWSGHMVCENRRVSG